MSHWKYHGKILREVPEDAFGFVYRITHKKSKLKYIGRKYFYTIRRIKRKGKKNRRVVTKESNWKTYTGSSMVLNDMKISSNKKEFTFEILAIGYTKGQINYIEENLQHKLDVLTNPEYLNDSVGSRRYIGIKNDDQFKNIVENISL